MDLRDLRYFEAIATLQHVGKASELLHRTQPALTSCIRRLEQQSGNQLFERAGRGIRLTPAGEVLLKWAQRLRFDLEDAQREMREIGHGLAGQVRIGIVPTAAQFLLPPVARRLLDEAPQVSLKTQVGLVDTLKPMLHAGELDLVVGTEIAAEAGLVSRLLDEDAIVVAASADHAFFRRRQPVRLAELVDEQWVLQPPGAPTRDWLDHTFDRHRLPRPRVKVESSMLLMLPPLIAETGLLSFISRHHLQGPKPGLREVPLRETTMQRKLVVAHRDGTYLSAAAQRVVELFCSNAPKARAGTARARVRSAPSAYTQP